MAICPMCEGKGFTLEIEAVCCGNFTEDWICCGTPKPEWAQVQCKCDNGNLIEENINQ